MGFGKYLKKGICLLSLIYVLVLLVGILEEISFNITKDVDYLHPYLGKMITWSCGNSGCLIPIVFFLTLPIVVVVVNFVELYVRRNIESENNNLKVYKRVWIDYFIIILIGGLFTILLSNFMYYIGQNLIDNISNDYPAISIFVMSVITLISIWFFKYKL